jgi:hypothetical protein
VRKVVVLPAAACGAAGPLLETINGKPAREFWKEVEAKIPKTKP